MGMQRTDTSGSMLDSKGEKKIYKSTSMYLLEVKLHFTLSNSYLYVSNLFYIRLSGGTFFPPTLFRLAPVHCYIVRWNFRLQICIFQGNEIYKRHNFKWQNNRSNALKREFLKNVFLLPKMKLKPAFTCNTSSFLVDSTQFFNRRQRTKHIQRN